ncbi:MAG: hypothetical protein WBE11_15970 [Candidatus Aminicenantaceae bacterium]
MSKRHLFISVILVIAFMASGCGQRENAVTPTSPVASSESTAVLTGNVSITGSDITLSDVQLGLQGTTNLVAPNTSGDFRMDSLPTGNQVVEVYVKGVTSQIMLENVQTQEEIQLRIEVKTNCQAVVAHMNRHRKSQGTLALDIRPGKWNLRWIDCDDCDDWVVAKISGEGHEAIDPTTVVMFGPDYPLGATLPLDTSNPDNWEVGGTYFTAKFPKEAAILLIPDPVPNTVYTITVTFTYSGGEGNLSDTILIHGKLPKTEDLSIQLNPHKWNTNWAKSNGTVMVKFWGSGYDTIEQADVKMIGPTDLEADPSSFHMTDDHFMIFFKKMTAIAIIPTPKKGDKHTITITGSNGGGSFSFQYGIEIVGSKK